MTDDDAQKIWEEIVELREELRQLTIDRKALNEQASELFELGEQLNESAHKAIKAAEVATEVANGKGADDAQAPVEDQ